jgi:hypothetical protein
MPYLFEIKESSLHFTTSVLLPPTKQVLKKKYKLHRLFLQTNCATNSYKARSEKETTSCIDCFFKASDHSEIQAIIHSADTTGTWLKGIQMPQRHRSVIRATTFSLNL